MKKISLTDIISRAFFLIFLSISTFAQVGVGTVTPDGVLDLNSDTGTNRYGLVLPRVTLASTILAAPIISPDGSASLAIGTVVYNTATTNTGSDDVYPGIYMWDGSDWINEFPKKDAEIFKQEPALTALRTVTTGSYQDIPNLVGRTFTPKYTGTYKIEISMNYGGGYVQNLGVGTDVAAQKGFFKFTFDGVDELTPLQTWSARHGSGTRYYDIWEQATIVLYKELVASTGYIFSLGFDQTQSDGFDNNGDSGNGMGWIGGDIPCTVEFVFLD